MISPDTPPGTEVVCIDDSPGAYGPTNLRMGDVYTLRSIEESVDGDFVATLHEVPLQTVYDIRFCYLQTGYLLCRFRYLEIPNSLNELLTVRELDLVE